jgi:hypothetical protein
VLTLTLALQAVIIVCQLEYWPLSAISMYSGYRPAVGYNLTHIHNRTYLDHLVNEMAPHVWSRRWTDVTVTELESGQRFKLHFCAPSTLAHRGVKNPCLVPDGEEMFDTEHARQATAGRAANGSAYLEQGVSSGALVRGVGMRPGGWGRQKPIAVMATLPGRRHDYCLHETLTPAQDFLQRNCAYLHALRWSEGRTLRAELVVHLGTGDLVVGSVECAEHARFGYTAGRVPRCIRKPF